jgi:CDP-glucose 4,6-dehydratase
LNKRFWKNKKVLVIGHTGFKGGWLTIVLNLLGAKVYGIGLKPETKPNFYTLANLKKYVVKDLRINIENYRVLNKEIKKIKPQIIFHLAAQSKVRESYISSLDTIKTNVMGTSNLLEIFKNDEYVNLLLITTTDKVYKNTNNKKLFNENDELGGEDIYSASKSAIEIITNAYNESFFKKLKYRSVITMRAGNVIGGGDWTKDRIIADCIRSMETKRKIILRNPKSIRPWQHVLEPLIGYIILAEKTYRNKSIYEKSFNFGPKISNCLDVKTLASTLIKLLNSKKKISLKKLNDNFYEKKYLFLNSAKAKHKIKWSSILNFNETLKLTADWYREYLDKKNVENKTISQIKFYLKKYYEK